MYVSEVNSKLLFSAPSMGGLVWWHYFSWWTGQIFGLHVTLKLMEWVVIQWAGKLFILKPKRGRLWLSHSIPGPFLWKSSLPLAASLSVPSNGLLLHIGWIIPGWEGDIICPDQSLLSNPYPLSLSFGTNYQRIFVTPIPLISLRPCWKHTF